MSPTAFVDISFTDGQSAAWDGALGTAMLAEAATHLRSAGLDAIEALSPAVIAQCLARGEHPLQRLEVLRQHTGGTPLRAAVSLVPDHTRFDELDGDLLDAWLRLLARHGISEVLLLDPFARRQRQEQAIRAAHRCGLTATVGIHYSGDATSESQLVQDAAQLAGAGADRIMLRDESGLLHLDCLNRLIPALRATLGSTPLDLHTRCHTGLGPQTALAAMQSGIDRLDTVLPCLANGASAPSLPHMIKSAGLMEIAVRAAAAAPVAQANAALAKVADQEGFPASLPWAFDLAPYIHKLPGEVAAEAMAKLRQCGRVAELHAFAHECEKVRREVGSPPMLQPFARPVMLMALAHMSGGERHTRLYPALRRMLQGLYGPPDAALDALRCRVGACHSPRTIPVPEDDDGLIAAIAGIEPAQLPARQRMQYESVTPEQALAKGLLQRWEAYETLHVTGPGLAIRLEHSQG